VKILVDALMESRHIKPLNAQRNA